MSNTEETLTRSLAKLQEFVSLVGEIIPMLYLKVESLDNAVTKLEMRMSVLEDEIDKEQNDGC